jgi:outer membrane protein OmpA-like peptidoglycan-associated protein
MSMLKASDDGGGLLDNLGDVLASPDRSQDVLRSGNSLLSGIFGDKLGGVLNALGGTLGQGKTASSSLLALAAPLVMSALGKQVSAGGLNPAGLLDLLIGQKNAVQAAAPSGLSSALGLNSLADLGTDATRRAAQVGSAAVRTGQAAAQQGTQWLKWAVPLALLLALGALIYFMRPSATPEPAAPESGPPVAVGQPAPPPDQTRPLQETTYKAAADAKETVAGAARGARDTIAGATEGVKEGAGRAAESARGAIAGAAEGVKEGAGRAAEATRGAITGAAEGVKEGAGRAAEATRGAIAQTAAGARAAVDGGLRKLSAVTLPNGLKLELPEGSGMSHLVAFLQAPKPGQPQTFMIDDTPVEPGTTKASASSPVLMDLLAKILKAFPRVNIKLVGHPDSATDTARRKDEGLRRATDAKAQLVERGVDANRIAAEGTEADKEGGHLELVVTKL